MIARLVVIFTLLMLLVVDGANAASKIQLKKTKLSNSTKTAGFETNYEYMMPDEDKMLIKAFVLATSKKWDEAYKYASRAQDSDYATTVVQALKFYNSPANYSIADIKKFFSTNGWLPIEMFEKKVEKSFNYKTASQDITNWFEYREPVTNYGKLIFLNSNIKSGRALLTDPEIRNSLRYYWRTTELDIDTEQYFLQNYKEVITIRDFLEKIEMLTWSKSYVQANILINVLPKKDKELPLLRIKILKDPKFLRQAIAANRAIINDDIVKYYIVSNLLNSDESSALEQLLKNKPKNNFEKWWKLKCIAIRNALRDKKYIQAYQLTQDHNLEYGPSFADAEWLAGWISFRFLADLSSAKVHFENLYTSAKLSNTRAKASYWLARVYEYQKSADSAQEWFEIASQYMGTFYGHLALARIDSSKINYFKDSIGDNVFNQELIANAKKVTRLAYILYKVNSKGLASDFIENLPYIDTDNQGLRFAAAYFSQKDLHPLAVEIGKSAVNKSAIVVKEGYPSKISITNNNLPKGLYLAIIRQESKFDPDAVSIAGARGLMQIMPETAYRLAKILGLPKDSYATSPKANILKGITYVDQLYAQYNNCVLTLAAYNAGSGNVRKWIDKYGDPRTFRTHYEVLDWVESIPFGETRDYVKKVLENFVVYDSIFSSQHNTQSIIAFLQQ